MQTQVKTYVNDGTFTCEDVRTYTMRFKENQFGVLEEIDGALDDALSGGGRGNEASPSEVIDRLAKQFMLDHPEFDYSAAVNRILDDRPDLKVFYASEEGGRVRVYAEKGGGGDPAEEIHEKAVSLLDREICSTYSEAAAKVLRLNPKLQQRWSQYASCGG